MAIRKLAIGHLVVGARKSIAEDPRPAGDAASRRGTCPRRFAGASRRRFRFRGAPKEQKMSAPSQPAVKLVPPFRRETAILKVRAVEDNWNSRDAERVSRGYSEDCYWRNRSEFIHGRAEVLAFLKRKW